MSETPLLDASTVRGGLDSLTWLLNNAQNHDAPEWQGLYDSARADRDAALEALGRLTAAALLGEVPKHRCSRCHEEFQGAFWWLRALGHWLVNGSRLP